MRREPHVFQLGMEIAALPATADPDIPIIAGGPPGLSVQLVGV
jgi:hypothetical protein